MKTITLAELERLAKNENEWTLSYDYYPVGEIVRVVNEDGERADNV